VPPRRSPLGGVGVGGVVWWVMGAVGWKWWWTWRWGRWWGRGRGGLCTTGGGEAVVAVIVEIALPPELYF